MKQHPILFSTPMVQAILEGRKTMTRRIIKPQPIDNTEEDGNFFEGNHKGYVKVDGHPYWRDQFVHEFSKKQVGDILWVREAHYKYGFWNKNGLTKSGKQKWRFVSDNQFGTKFTNDPPIRVKPNSYREAGWYRRSSLFMHKEACRLYLEVTGIRVERLQDITPGDACDEGIEYWNIDGDALEGGELQADFKNYTWRDDESYPDYHFPTFASCVESFRTLWQSINGPESWEVNPWVWVIEFKKIAKP